FHATDGSSVSTEVEGEGMDSGDKSSNKAMAVAHKYAILQAFCIPTEDMPDPDAEVHQPTPKPPKTPPTKANEPPSVKPVRAMLTTIGCKSADDADAVLAFCVGPTCNSKNYGANEESAKRAHDAIQAKCENVPLTKMLATALEAAKVAAELNKQAEGVL